MSEIKCFTKVVELGSNKNNSPLNEEAEIFTDVYDKSYTIESVDSRINNILKNK